MDLFPIEVLFFPRSVPPIAVIRNRGCLGFVEVLGLPVNRGMFGERINKNGPTQGCTSSLGSSSCQLPLGR